MGRGFLPGPAIQTIKEQILQEINRNKTEYKPPETLKDDRNEDARYDNFFDELTNKKNAAKKAGLPEETGKSPDTVTVSSDIKEEAESDTAEKTEGARVKAGSEENAESNREPVPENDNLQYTVQIASIGDREKAEKTIQALVDQGYDAYYYTAQVNGKTYFRIRCGRFDDRNSALEYSGKLEKETGYKGFVSKVE